MALNVKGVLARSLLAALSIYIVLLVVEIAIESRTRFDARLQGMSVRPMLRADPDYGYSTVPNAEVVFEDGVERIPMRVNSLGQRDDEPADTTRLDDDLLLLGDSFAFGLGLPYEDTINASFERQSGGEVTLYCAGVPGWGAGQARLNAERLPFSGDHVAYLYYVNDGRFDNVWPDAVTVRQGLIMPRRTMDGREFSDEQLDARIESILHEKTTGEAFIGWVSTVSRLSRVRMIVQSLRDEQLRLTGIPRYLLTDELREQLLADVVAMSEAVAPKHFFVVIAPARAEAIGDHWSPATEAVISGLEERGIEVHDELAERLDNDDFLVHDGHFGPRGAERTAELLLEVVAPSRLATGATGGSTARRRGRAMH